jgi:hypothetical protein
VKVNEKELRLVIYQRMTDEVALLGLVRHLHRDARDSNGDPRVTRWTSEQLQEMAVDTADFLSDLWKYQHELAKLERAEATASDG